MARRRRKGVAPTAATQAIRNAHHATEKKGDMAVRKEVRLVLKDKGLHTVPGLFDRAYGYIAEHY